MGVINNYPEDRASQFGAKGHSKAVVFSEALTDRLIQWFFSVLIIWKRACDVFACQLQ